MTTGPSSHFRFRKGALVFLAALCAFIFCGIWLHVRYTRQMEVLDAASKVLKTFPLNQIDRVLIEKKTDDLRQIYWVNVKYSSQAAEATVRYNRYDQKIGSRIDPGVLVIEIEGIGDADYRSSDVVEITLPFSVKALSDMGSNRIELSSETEQPLPELAVHSSSCDADWWIGKLTVQRLEFHRRCSEDQPAMQQNARGDLNIGGQADIRFLAVHTSTGDVTIDPQTRVQDLRLALAPEVVVKAPAGLLQRAQLRVLPAAGAGSSGARP